MMKHRVKTNEIFWAIISRGGQLLITKATENRDTWANDAWEMGNYFNSSDDAIDAKKRIEAILEEGKQ